MIRLSFEDPNPIENAKAAMALQKSGMFTDEEIQELYDRQVKKDMEAQNVESESI